MTKKVLLFDIDQTLLYPLKNSAHEEAFRHAFATVYKTPQAAIGDIDFPGKIDTQITIEVLALYGISEAEVRAQLPVAMQVMADYFIEQTEGFKPQLMPGVQELLQVLQSQGIVMGLLTGNVEAIGWRKMELAGLRDFFQFGAFGSMGFRRSELVPIALEQVQTFQPTTVLSDLMIVGDTPRDVQCGIDAGIETIGVGAGNYSLAQLQAAGATYAISSLEDTSTFLSFLR